MLLLVSGASGSGESTVRQRVAPMLGDGFEAAECHDFAAAPDPPTKAWRQWTAELAVRRAIGLQREGRSLLLSGDPIAPGEVVAARSAGLVFARARRAQVDQALRMTVPA